MFSKGRLFKLCQLVFLIPPLKFLGTQLPPEVPKEKQCGKINLDRSIPNAEEGIFLHRNELSNCVDGGVREKLKNARMQNFLHSKNVVQLTL